MEQFGLLNDENSEKYRPWFTGISKFVRNMWPLADQEAIELGTHFFIFANVFDDLIDTNEPEIGMKQINRAINIVRFGKLEDEPTPLERDLIYFFENLEVRFGNQNPVLNQFRNVFIDYFNGLMPWQNIKKLNGDMSMNLYYNMRNLNIGVTPNFGIGVLFTMKRLNSNILLDPLWKCLKEQAGRICALYNDVFSYEKELKENDVRMNSFHFMKTQNNWTDQECLEFVEKELDDCFEQYFIHENLIIQKFIPTLQIKEDQEEFYQIVDIFHKIVSSVLNMYKQKPKYKSTDSIFVELRI
ncbi:hypothetical protein PPL_10203 [Heterostelium album PN500]|uniref:Terpene synthase n=1 Tax=Heterostelium pallidum (strain ATCC 26659 / Pp 5 / PN500) TaxID=670386 RepID=D3BQL8_HETP5|nr:hypothetical protein PPL_10203 [Heterostelium album PN500]EFA76438.1 hypothetical protein PPL_10203 [Heterostelium album PN500]|eukprot:XP_020428570.1 hypothetical protein PPL_10203 [Heterostelium album PN500]